MFHCICLPILERERQSEMEVEPIRRACTTSAYIRFARHSDITPTERAALMLRYIGIDREKMDNMYMELNL